MLINSENSTDAPLVVVIAGPNGSGKSTAAPYLLRDYAGVREFVNADDIARGLSVFQPESVGLQAGRIMLRRLQELAKEQKSFAFETTLASSSFAPWLRALQKEGYRVHLIFLWLPAPELAVQRVQGRVELGGHSVPETTIHRRYQAGLSNLLRNYIPFVESWLVMDNSSNALVPIAHSSNGQPTVFKEELWNQIQSGHP